MLVFLVCHPYLLDSSITAQEADFCELHYSEVFLTSDTHCFWTMGGTKRFQVGNRCLSICFAFPFLPGCAFGSGCLSLPRLEFWWDDFSWCSSNLNNIVLVPSFESSLDNISHCWSLVPHHFYKLVPMTFLSASQI